MSIRKSLTAATAISSTVVAVMVGGMANADAASTWQSRVPKADCAVWLVKDPGPSWKEQVQRVQVNRLKANGWFASTTDDSEALYSPGCTGLVG